MIHPDLSKADTIGAMKNCPSYLKGVRFIGIFLREFDLKLVPFRSVSKNSVRYAEVSALHHARFREITV